MNTEITAPLNTAAVLPFTTTTNTSMMYSETQTTPVTHTPLIAPNTSMTYTQNSTTVSTCISSATSLSYSLSYTVGSHVTPGSFFPNSTTQLVPMFYPLHPHQLCEVLDIPRHCGSCCNEILGTHLGCLACEFHLCSNCLLEGSVIYVYFYVIIRIQKTTTN